MSPTRLRVLVFSVALALAACSPPGSPPPPRSGGPTPAPARAPVSARVVPVVRQTLAQTIESVGTVKSRRQSVLSSKVLAAVVAVHATEGQRVHAGQVLVTLDDRDLRTQVRRAEAAVRGALDGLDETERAIRASERATEAAIAQRELATATLGRYRTLLDRGSVARQEYEEVAARARSAAAEVERLQETSASLGARRRQAQARIEEGEAELANTNIALGYARLLAPADGIVVAKTVEAGNTAAPGLPLLTIEEERYRLEAAVEESAIRQIRPGQAAVVTIDALASERRGAVTEIVPAADAASRTFVVKIDLGAVPGLRSGLYGRARFTVGERTALVVPRAALVERGQLQAVFVVDTTGVARLRLVRTGAPVGDGVEVLSGLAEGDRVAVERVGVLVDGTPVEPRG